MMSRMASQVTPLDPSAASWILTSSAGSMASNGYLGRPCCCVNGIGVISSPGNPCPSAHAHTEERTRKSSCEVRNQRRNRPRPSVDNDGNWLR